MAVDSGEPVSRIEPCRLEEAGEEVTDIVAELTAAATTLGRKLHPRTADSLAGVVRVMNTYYSNLIEGHKTHLRDIERAIKDDLDNEKGKRSLQIEARAHIWVQEQIDRMYVEDRLSEVTSTDFILWLHHEFYRDASPEMLWIERKTADGAGSGAGFSMIPGEFRSLPEHDVEVGEHVPPSSPRVADFMRYFASRYRMASMGKGARIIAMAAAHHRLNYIHPFPDGNGRVSRLMSHAMGLEAGIGARGLWSVSRGLARGLNNSPNEYKRMMAHADMHRQGDLDGRGNLSRRALQEFVLWFLRVCLDQVTFMGGLFDLDNLTIRLREYIEHSDKLRPEAFYILDEVMRRGEMARGDAARVSGLGERVARTVLGDLTEDGILASDTPKGPVSLRFPAHAVEQLFPRLYPNT